MTFIKTRQSNNNFLYPPSIFVLFPFHQNILLFSYDYLISSYYKTQNRILLQYS